MVDMNRIHFWHYVLNEEGQPIQNAEIRLYLNDAPTTEAIIYITETAISSTTCKNADIKTDKDGFFEFWLAGESDSGGYPHTQKFILEWFKAGTRPGYIYNLNPWPNALVWRDTNIGVGKDNLNKFISDYLANKWWTHTELIVPSAAPHNLQPVDFESGCNDDVYNKIVSNKFLNDILNGCYAGDTFDLSTIYDGVQEHIETVTSWTALGDLYYIDISHPTVNNVSSVRMVDINTFEEVIPAEIEHLTAISTRVYIDVDIDVKITIQGDAV